MQTANECGVRLMKIFLKRREMRGDRFSRGEMGASWEPDKHWLGTTSGCAMRWILGLGFKFPRWKLVDGRCVNIGWNEGRIF